MADYIVKRGDTLWAIAKAYKSKISGSTINAKIDTLVKVNKIKNRNLIYPGQEINFSSSSSSSTSSTTSTPNINKVVIDTLALQASDVTEGRNVYASWNWTRSNTKECQVQWYQWLNGQWVDAGNDTRTIPDNVTTQEEIDALWYSTFKADAESTKVKIGVLPIAKDKSNNKPYWKKGSGSQDVQWTYKEYNFADNPPLVPGTPTVEFDELNDRKLKMSYSFTEAQYKTISATAIKFNVIQNDTASIYVSDPVPIKKISDGYYFVSHEYVVSYGATYKVRACAVGANNKESAWSDFSTTALETRPIAPKSIKSLSCHRDTTTGNLTVRIEWEPVPNAAKYVVEWNTNADQLAQGQTSGSRTTIDARTYMDIEMDSGTYFFQVRSSNDKGESDPTPPVSIAIGIPPAAPTTWVSSSSVFVGDPLELGWTHNSADESAQTFAQLALKIGEGEWKEYTFKNETTKFTGEQTVKTEFIYGEAISYKGELYVKIDTNRYDLADTTLDWKVRTVGIRGAFGDPTTSDWSEWSSYTGKTIKIYTKPTLALSVTKDEGGRVPFDNVEIAPEEEGEAPSIVEKALTSFPFYINAKVSLDSYELQRPIGYYIRIIAEDPYETVDESGRTKNINPGDAVYTLYSPVPVENPVLALMMTADMIDLEPLIRYTVKCDVDMSTGLILSVSDNFNVLWEDKEYFLDAIITVDTTHYTATIIPTCEDSDGNLIENITMSVYRREYDGKLTEIATGIPNNGTAVADPHPALDFARYRLIARDTNTGAISFYDKAGHKIGCSSVIIQWDEEWVPYDASDKSSMEPPNGSGVMLVLPYNVKVTDNRQREVSRIAYAGREYPVSYHGTMITESSTWNTVISKDDADSIYALRRLSLWPGVVYVREPSGMGFWANVTPSFNIDRKSVSIPVTLSVTRVEGGA